MKPGLHGRTLISWFNSSLPYEICHRKAIDSIRYIMLTRKRDRVRNDFIRAMSLRFHIRDVQFELFGDLFFVNLQNFQNFLIYATFFLIHILLK